VSPKEQEPKQEEIFKGSVRGGILDYRFRTHVMADGSTAEQASSVQLKCSFSPDEKDETDVFLNNLKEGIGPR